MITLAFTILLSSSSVHAANCVTYFLRGSAALALGLAGRSYMEEGRPVREQLIARDRPTPEVLAIRWMRRDDESKITWSPGLDYWGPGTERPAFIQTIPHWLVMTNAEIRPFVELWQILEMVKDYGFEDDVLPHVVEHLDPKITAVDLAAWDLAFPHRPIPDRVRALFKL